jgi:hypothetical protein
MTQAIDTICLIPFYGGRDVDFQVELFFMTQKIIYDICKGIFTIFG